MTTAMCVVAALQCRDAMPVFIDTQRSIQAAFRTLSHGTHLSLLCESSAVMTRRSNLVASSTR
jgi:hypothetical protein